MSTDEIINGLRHMADDHTCCGKTIKAAIEKIQALERDLAAKEGQPYGFSRDIYFYGPTTISEDDKAEKLKEAHDSFRRFTNPEPKKSFDTYRHPNQSR